jgi:hypothetical protein
LILLKRKHLAITTSLDNKSTSNPCNKAMKQAMQGGTSKAISLNKSEDDKEGSNNDQDIKKSVRGLRILVVKNKKPKWFVTLK